MARVITVKAIYTAPVKSLALQQPEKVHVGFRGIAEDRRLYLINGEGKLLTQRELGRLVQVKTEYLIEPESPESESLRLTFPNGDTCQGPINRGRGISTMIWGRRVRGHLVNGGWNEALSQFCGEPVQMVTSDDAGQAFDEFPVSIVSEASLQRLTEEASSQTNFQGSLTSTRFRPNFLLGGCHPHEEDSWLSGVIQVGDELRLQPVMPDPRCSIITQNPTTGERDVDTLRLIMGYRPSPRNAYFGIYAIVENPGVVSVRDELKVIRSGG
jgi:uncharacterized protein YcbX